MKLYYSPGACSFSPHIVLRESGLAFEPVLASTKTHKLTDGTDFYTINPLGYVPVLELDDGSAIAESLAICRYLEAMQPLPPLMGRTSQASAHIEMWTLRMDHELSQPIALAFVHSSDFYRGRVEQVPEVASWARGRALQTMTWLDGELAGRNHIAGEDYTMADIVAQCACVLGKAVGLRIPPEMTHLSRWFAQVSARPTARA